MKTIPIYRAAIKDDEDGIFKIAFVQEPAIEKTYVKFDKQVDVKFSAIDEEKRIFAGPILIPDMLIYRNPSESIPTEHYIVYSESDIEKFKERFIVSGNLTNFKKTHKGEDLKNVQIVEIWQSIDANTDKSTVLGIQDCPKGTLFILAKANDVETWNTLKSDQFKGFSIEATISLLKVAETQMSKESEKEYFDRFKNELIKILDDKDFTVEALNTFLDTF